MDFQRKRDDLHKDGYVTMENVFSDAEIAELRALLLPMFDRFGELPARRARDVGAMAGQRSGSQQPEIDRASRFDKRLMKTAVYQKAREVAAVMMGRRAHYVFDHAICKMPDSSTPTAWHQDQGYMLAGATLKTLNFWIPLQDVDESNGTMQYVPGSHRQEMMAHKQDPALHPHVKTAGQVDENKAVTCVLKAGDLVLHHPLTLHGAGPNMSQAERLAWSIHFGPYGRFEYLNPANLLGIISGLFRHEERSKAA